MPEDRCGQHGPNEVARNEPSGKTSEARSMGGSHLFALAYWILQESCLVYMNSQLANSSALTSIKSKYVSVTTT